MRDLLPADMRAFRRVEDAFRAATSRWGYEEVRTPTIENYSLFTVAGALTPQMLSRVYTFLDWDGWSGERVVLRPDSTIPVARAAAQGGIEFPARLFYVQNVFRFSDSDDREDWQLGIEYLGAPAPVGDIEVAAIACETLDGLGLEPEVRVAHIGIARALIDALSTGESASAELSARVASQGLAALGPAAGMHNGASAFLDIALRPGGVPLLDNMEALAAPLPGAVAALRELRSIAAALSGAGRKVVIDLGLPHDFEYYTGVVFEFAGGGHSWGRGGRYRPAGPGTPESACGIGLDAAQLAAHLTSTTRPPMVVSIVPASESDLARAVSVARALHRSGIAAALSAEGEPAPMAVRVSADGLIARTPDGERRMAALDDVVGLLLQFK
ncbi:MAG: ATP phosphoribosyltransferase regulatory subunit [Thermoflexaceae bacterium]|nr:ATP phosphoribosyltransferase regulatory subunit [Thermoflexaceae bacterium]